jgi:hypothetical protein
LTAGRRRGRETRSFPGFGETVLANRTFEQWVDGIFDHPVGKPEWFWDLDADTCEEDDETNVDYLARLFADSGRLLRRFHDAQVNQGLNMIVSNSCSDHAFSIVGGDAPWPARRRAIRAIFDVYAGCFANRCAEGLSHCKEVANPLNSICYMWWDVFPAWGDPGDPSQSDEAGEYLGVMERCLSLTHHACLEGALHGLGHWQLIFPERVEPIIERFLRERNDLRPELVAYARRAHDGAVQ